MKKLVLKNLGKLIVETANEAKSDWAIKEDMADMFKADWQDYVNVNDLIVSGNTSEVKSWVNEQLGLKSHFDIGIASDVVDNCWNEFWGSVHGPYG